MEWLSVEYDLFIMPHLVLSQTLLVMGWVRCGLVLCGEVRLG